MLVTINSKPLAPLSCCFVYKYALITRARSIPQAHRISIYPQNFAKVGKLPAIGTIVSLMMQF